MSDAVRLQSPVVSAPEVTLTPTSRRPDPVVVHENSTGQSDLDRNGVTSHRKVAFDLKFSFVSQAKPSVAEADLLKRTVETKVIPGATMTGGKFENPVTLLDHINQHDNLKSTNYDNTRCGATVVFAELVMRGPAAVQKKVDEIRNKIALAKLDDPERTHLNRRESAILKQVTGLERVDFRNSSYQMTLADAHHIIDGIYALSSLKYGADVGTKPQDWIDHLGGDRDQLISPGATKSMVMGMRPNERMALSYTTAQFSGHVVMVTKADDKTWLVHNSEPVKDVKDGLPVGNVRRMNREQIADFVGETMQSLWLRRK